MKLIYGKTGKTVGWLQDNGIYDLKGKPQAFVLKKTVFNYQGVYLGYLKSGYFRDESGDAVAFLEGANDGPVTPVPEIPPVEPVPTAIPVTPAPTTPKVKSVPTYNWSKLSWVDYLREKN